jgi:hypothetical protein
MDAVRAMVPHSTYGYFETERGQRTARMIRESASIVHY